MPSNSCGLVKWESPMPATSSPANFAIRESVFGTAVYPLCSSNLVVTQRKVRCFFDRFGRRHRPQQRRLALRVEVVGARRRTVADRPQRIAEQLGHSIAVTGVGFLGDLE